MLSSRDASPGKKLLEDDPDIGVDSYLQLPWSLDQLVNALAEVRDTPWTEWESSTLEKTI